MTIYDDTERPSVENAVGSGPLVAGNQYPDGMPVDRDAVRALLRRKLALRAEEDAILVEQERIILGAFNGGARPVDIARLLTEVADELEVPEDDRRGLGLTDSTVHAVLRPHRRRSTA